MEQRAFLWLVKVVANKALVPYFSKKPEFLGNNFLFLPILMSNAIYLILVLVVAFISIISGFRKGLTSQIASLLGFGFGAVAARVLTPEFSANFQWAAAFSQEPEFSDFTVNLVCGVTVYFVVYCLFSILTPIFKATFGFIPVGIFNRLTGAFFSLTKNLLWLSILFNLALCFSSGSRLLRYERANDGNLIAAVMDLTPAILGCYGAGDFAHFNQLREAKTISCNFNETNNVIMNEGVARPEETLSPG